MHPFLLSNPLGGSPYRSRPTQRRLALESLESRHLLSIDLVSVSLSDLAGNNGSDSACISGDGRYVAFDSVATDLVSDDTNGYRDVFVRDLVSGSTVRVSTDSAGVQGDRLSVSPGISADGRQIVFCSTARNLVADDANLHDDIFVKDLATGSTTLVSTDAAGSQANHDSSKLGR